MNSFLFLCLLIIITTNKLTPNNNLRKDRVKRNVQIRTDFPEDTDIVIDTNDPQLYIINITYYYFYDQGLDLYLFSDPEINVTITLLITLYIDQFNDSLGYWTSKEIDVRAYDYDGTGELFSAYIDDLILDDSSSISISILNIIIESNNTISNYYVYFEEMTYTYPEDTSIGDWSDLHEEYVDYSTDTDIYSSLNDTNNTDISPINRASKSSGSIPIGAIIGIISAVIVVGVVIVTICLCRRKKTRPPEGPPEVQPGQKKGSGITQGIKNGDTLVNDTLEKFEINQKDKTSDIIPKRTFILKTTSQKEIKIEIEENKNIGDLRKLYFETIGQPYLNEDKTIYFLVDGNYLSTESNILIKDKFNENDKKKVIIIADNEDKIKLQ